MDQRWWFFYSYPPMAKALLIAKIILLFTLLEV